MKTYKAGVDIGSTTAKMVVYDDNNKMIFSTYRRHNAEVKETLSKILEELREQEGDLELSIAMTGTAGMGISEKTHVAFVQEVIASSTAIREIYPYCRTLIDIGGEDAKIIFFDDNFKGDIRMNGNCAGGTGAFIDQMASLLNIEASELSPLAEQATHIYPMASRCGVFAKTDVQTLISRNISKMDISKSIFNAVALQTVNTLSKGFDIEPKILFTGGPLTFIPELRKSFLNVLNMTEADVYDADHTELIAAMGAAYSDDEDKTVIQISKFLELIDAIPVMVVKEDETGMALFKDEKEFLDWKEAHAQHKVHSIAPSEVNGKKCFLGMDSGSTTTKTVLVDEEGRVVASDYRNNHGNPIDAAKGGIAAVYEKLKEAGSTVEVASSAVTGYGEDLIKSAFKMDNGIVETMAHYEAAKSFDKDVSFILDIGGQDMKAIFIKDGIIENIEINEACSSGCGSFIETFAKTMGHTTADFALLACESKKPCELGSRCTVFMNSKVKQSLREGAGVSDIAAGLAMSVVRNCFTKVLKIADVGVLGGHIVVQGGTFKNYAVLRSVEKFLNTTVVRPDISELMGAFGSALVALAKYKAGESAKTSTFIGFENLDAATDYERKQVTCRGCENNCSVTRLKFSDKDVFYTGNKCEKVFNNHGGVAQKKGLDITKKKLEILFERPFVGDNHSRKEVIGIPRVLNMYQNFPFWSTLFTEMGFKIHLSAKSSMVIADKGSGTVMSDNICFPAKIANGHVYDLIEAKVDRIFYPSIVLEANDQEDAVNSFNCPVVTGYPDVIDSAVDPTRREGIPFDAPSISFLNDKLLYNGCRDYFIETLGVDIRVFNVAFAKAKHEQKEVKHKLKIEAKHIIDDSKKNKTPLMLLVGRPYHIDELINHKIPDIITSFGINVITEDVVDAVSLGDVQVLTQWAYPNKMYNAVLWACKQKDFPVEVVQINSFGCGPDATTIDEIKSLLNSYGKNPTLVRVDDITSAGSIKLRLRSLVESMKMKVQREHVDSPTRTLTKTFEIEDKKKMKVIGPLFSPFYSPFIGRVIAKKYDFETLPPPDAQSVELGLRYANHDICYPATVVIGDIIKALQSGKYDVNNTTATVSQTGGQCRASSYAALMKRALINAGFENVPVVTVGLRTINKQPGFKVSKVDLAKQGAISVPYGDAISKLYYYTAVREVKKGTSRELAEKYIHLFPKNFSLRDSNKLLKKAVAEFNMIDINEGVYPKAGIVGEIYVKYNDFSNGYTVDWLINRGIEVVISPLFDFFAQKAISMQVNYENHTKDINYIKYKLAQFGEKVINKRIDNINDMLSDFRGFRPMHHISATAENAKKVVAMTNQFGEAWLLPGEIATFAEEGINNVLCMQPFGCIANHIIARGIETRLKKTYPNLNLLYLDMDSGISEVNTVNRLEFFVRSAKDSIKGRAGHVLSDNSNNGDNDSNNNGGNNNAQKPKASSDNGSSTTKTEDAKELVLS